MPKVWKILALLLVITALVWLTTMWRWQSTRVDPTSADLAIHLGALPVMLTAALVAGIFAVKRLRRYAAVPAVPASATAPAQAGASAASTASETAADERRSSFEVLAASVQSRAGSTWAGAMASVASGECKPELDANLKDDKGIAVFTAPHPDLSTDALADAIRDVVAQFALAEPDAWHGYQVPDEMLRALSLIEMAVQSSQEAVEAQWPALREPISASRDTPASQPLPPRVSIRVAISARWPAPSQRVAEAWIRILLKPVIDSGLEAAGQSHAMAQGAHPAVQLHVHAITSAEACWLLLDQQLIQWQRDKQPGLLWALAADSLVGENDVAALTATSELFSGENQRGRVPGEAAAALLVASPAWPTITEAGPPLARLHRANLLRRDKSADAVGRISAQTLQQTLTGSLQASACDTAQVSHITTDTDHRASRTGEVYESIQELLPHIETDEQVLRIGMGCGDMGVARLLTCTALSALQVQESQKPALVLGAAPSFDRFALVVMPAVAPAAGAALATSSPASATQPA